MTPRSPLAKAAAPTAYPPPDMLRTAQFRRLSGTPLDPWNSNASQCLQRVNRRCDDAIGCAAED